MSTLTYTIGDATRPRGDYTHIRPRNEHMVIPHVCNDVGRWGAGFVLAISARWKEPEHHYRNQELWEGWRLGDTHKILVEPQTTVINMIAQHGVGFGDGRPPIRYGALVQTMSDVARFCQAHNIRTSIHAPRFGSGLAGGDWGVIEQLIMELWVDQGIPVTIYDLG